MEHGIKSLTRQHGDGQCVCPLMVMELPKVKGDVPPPRLLPTNGGEDEVLPAAYLEMEREKMTPEWQAHWRCDYCGELIYANDPDVQEVCRTVVQDQTIKLHFCNDSCNEKFFEDRNYSLRLNEGR